MTWKRRVIIRGRSADGRWVTGRQAGRGEGIAIHTSSEAEWITFFKSTMELHCSAP